MHVTDVGLSRRWRPSAHEHPLSTVCGPGSIEQAHKPDEFVAQGRLDRCEAFLGALIRHCRA
jgi:acetylornithine deacetylase/succinyl-diaminopimelate desuccinylase-like protein